MTSFRMSSLGWVGTFALLMASGCSNADPNSGSSQEGVKGANAQCDDEEEANDKITCSVDADCDSDETCVNGLCTGADGENEEDADADADDCDEAGDADDDDTEDADDEEEDDKITCATDASCDADEICMQGLCTGIPEVCEADADCDADEACTNGLCEDR